MIMTVEQAKELVNLEGWTDAKIEMKLKAIEQTVRAYTNNSFQNRERRIDAFVREGGLFMSEALIPFDVGDTVQISKGKNKGLFTVSESNELTFVVKEKTCDEDEVIVTKIEYPADVVDCAVNLLEWERDFRKNVGVKSKSLSRHSVTYEDSASMFMGYPKGILSSLFPYRKARC